MYFLPLLALSCAPLLLQSPFLCSSFTDEDDSDDDDEEEDDLSAFGFDAEESDSDMELEEMMNAPTFWHSFITQGGSLDHSLQDEDLQEEHGHDNRRLPLFASNEPLHCSFMDRHPHDS